MSAITTPNSVMNIARNARRAIIQRTAMNRIGPMLVGAMGLSAMVILIDRVWMNAIGVWWGVPIVLGIVAIGWGWIDAIRKSPSSNRSAGVLDDRLGLNSQLRSALELHADQNSAGFVELAMRDADKLALSVNPSAALPEHRTTPYWYAGIIAAACVAIGVWVPVRTMTTLEPIPTPPARALLEIESAEEVTREIEQDEGTPESVREQLQELEDLKNELAQGVTDEQEADARTAAKLEEIADSMDQAAAESKERADAMSESLESLMNQKQAQQEQWDPRVEEFVDSFERQDFEDAADQIEELNRAMESMTPEQREQIAQQLEEIANAIEPDEVEQPAEQTPDASRDSVEQSQPETQQNTEQDPQTPTEQAPSPPQNPAQAQEQSSEQQQEPQQQGEQQEQREETSPQEQGGQEQSPSESNPNEQGEENQQNQEGNKQQQEQGESQSEQQQGNEQEQGNQGQEQQDAPSNEPGDQNAQRPTQDPANQEQQPSDLQSGEKQTEQIEQEGDRGEQREVESPSEVQEQGQEQREQASEQETNQDQARRAPSASESLEERLRQMQQEQQQSQRQRERAEQLREQAERLIRDPSEEEGQGARRAPDQTTPPESSEGGGDGERDPNTPDATRSDRESDFVPVDARDQENDASGQPIGEWYAPEGEPAPPGTNEQTAQRFRRASQEAQKAVDEQQVPRRYRHLIKEVFQRVQERADKLDGKGTIAPQGQDAVPSNQKPEGSEQGG